MAPEGNVCGYVPGECSTFYNSVTLCVFPSIASVCTRQEEAGGNPEAKEMLGLRISGLFRISGFDPKSTVFYSLSCDKLLRDR